MQLGSERHPQQKKQPNRVFLRGSFDDSPNCNTEPPGCPKLKLFFFFFFVPLEYLDVQDRMIHIEIYEKIVLVQDTLIFSSTFVLLDTGSSSSPQNGSKSHNFETSSNLVL